MTFALVEERKMKGEESVKIIKLPYLLCLCDSPELDNDADEDNTFNIFSVSYKISGVLFGPFKTFSKSWLWSRRKGG
jgi:hypothetical protein